MSGNTQFKIEQGLLVVSDGANSDFFTNVNVTGIANVNGAVFASNITVGGTLINAAAISTTNGNFTVVTAGGANVNINGLTSTIKVGNSTLNAVMAPTVVQVMSSTATANLNPTQLVIGGTVVNSSTVNTSVVNAATSIAVGANVNISTSLLTIGNSTLNTTANNTTIKSGSAGFTGTLNVSVSASIGTPVSNVFANSTILIVSNSSSSANITPASLAIGSSVVNSSNVQTGIGSFTTSVGIASNVAINTSALGIGNSTVNSTTTSTLLQITDSGSTANLTSTQLKIGSLTVNATTFSGANSQLTNQLSVAGFTGNIVIQGGFSVPLITIGNSTINSIVSMTSVNSANFNAGALVNVGTGNGNSVINSTALTIGNTTVNSIVNSTFFTGTSNIALTANNATNLGGLAAAGYATLAGNQTFTGNNIINGTNTVINSNTTLTGSLSGVTSLFTTSVGVGANVNISTSVLTVGNSIFNAAVNSTFIQIQNTTSLLNVRSIGVFVGNTTLNRNSLISDIGTYNTSVAVGGNVTINTTSIVFGNSTINTTVNSIGYVSIGLGAGQGSLNSSALLIGDSFNHTIANSSAITVTAGIFSTANVDTSLTIGTSTIAITGSANAINFNQNQLYGTQANIQFLTANGYTLQATDTDTIIDIANTTVIRARLPGTLPVGFKAKLVQSGTGIINLTPTGSATLHQRQNLTNTAGQWAVVSVFCRSNSNGTAAEFVAYGDVA